MFAFLFTTVAALATAMTGNNPISGMTLVTLIIGSSALVAVGLQGEFGKYAAIVMGAVVCTSLSMAGGFVTDLKVGYWLGATPRNQQLSKVIGTLFAAVGVALTVLLIHKAFGHNDPATGKFISGFMNTAVVPAPQANLFATILSGIFDNAPVTWLLYAVGLVLSLLLVMMGIPPLAFAIGMYLPLQINTPLFIGGLISHWVGKSSRDKKVSEARVAARHAGGQRLHRRRGAGRRAGRAAAPDQDRRARSRGGRRDAVDRPVHRAAAAHGLQRGPAGHADPLDRLLRRALRVPVLRRAPRQGRA